MRKAYSKPEIFFEDFSLTSSIAAGCGITTDLQNAGTCGVSVSGYNVFFTGMQGCNDIPVSIDGEFNGLCYHTPVEANLLFNS